MASHSTMHTRPPTLDVQSQLPPVAAQPLAGRRDRRREGDPARARTAPSTSSGRASSASSSSAPTRRARTCRASRRSSTRRSARSCSASRRSTPRRSPSTSPSSCASARARAAPRSRVEARFPEHKPAPVSGHPDPGAVHAARLRGRTEPGTRRADRRRRPGHDRLPVRAGAGRRRARANGSTTRASTPSEIERILEAVPVATHNQRGLGTLHIGCPRAARGRDRRAGAAARSSSSRCPRRSTS